MKKIYTFKLKNQNKEVEVNGNVLLYLIHCEVLKKLVIDFQVGRAINTVHRPAVLTLDCSDSFLNIMSGE